MGEPPADRATQPLGRLAAAVLALAAATAVAPLVIWLFGIPLADVEMLARFPEGWRVVDLVANAFAVLLWGGLVHVVYGAARATWDGREEE